MLCPQLELHFLLRPCLCLTMNLLVCTQSHRLFLFSMDLSANLDSWLTLAAASRPALLLPHSRMVGWGPAQQGPHVTTLGSDLPSFWEQQLLVLRWEVACVSLARVFFVAVGKLLHFSSHCWKSYIFMP